MTAWVDYIDARRRLLHEWAELGVPHDEMAVRIELDEQRIAAILSQPADPFPGSSRHQVAEWRARCAALEAELAAVGVPSEQPPPPLESEFRALMLNPDPELCGCQYWVDRPRAGAHHPQCEHAPRS